MAHATRIVAVAVLTALALCAPVQAQTPEIDALRVRADQGNATAQFSLGVMYANGESVPQDFAEAQYNLGSMSRRPAGRRRSRAAAHRCEQERAWLAGMADGAGRSAACQELRRRPERVRCPFMRWGGFDDSATVGVQHAPGGRRGPCAVRRRPRLTRCSDPSAHSSCVSTPASALDHGPQTGRFWS
jgi:hypothetical protein